MPTTKPEHPPATLTQIPLDQLHIDETFNPRSTMNDTKLAELTASVAQVGVLQPIIVTPTAGGEGYRLVAGHRRVQAARRAKLAAIPALVREQVDEQARLQIAIVENLQREDINPIDEAAGYERAAKEFNLTQKQLAKLVGKSHSHICDRLRLRKLPPGCQREIAAGTLPLSAAKPLAQIAKVAPDVADGCARLIASGNADPDELTNEPHHLVSQLAQVDWHDAPFVQPCRTYSPQPIRFGNHIPTEQVEALAARAQSLGVTHFAFSDEDIDAARAYNCLLEFNAAYTTHRYITDARFAFDRITQALDTTEAHHTAQNAAEAPHRPDPAGTTAIARTAGAAAPPGDMHQRRDAREQRQRRLERQQQEQARLDAIAANRQLGATLQAKLGSRKLDRPTAQLLARLVLDQNRDMAGRGIRYTHDDYHTLQHTRQKNGTTRTTFTPLAPHEAHQQLTTWVLRPKQPEEIIGRLLQAIIAGTFADQHAVAKSHRTHWHNAPTHDTRTLIATTARKLLPDHFTDHLRRILPDTPATTQRPSAPKAATDAN